MFTINNNIGKLGFKGVGTNIMKKIIEISKKERKNGIFLSPLELAKPFYEKFGFKYIDTELFGSVYMLQFEDKVPPIPIPYIDGTRRRSRKRRSKKKHILLNF